MEDEFAVGIVVLRIGILLKWLNMKTRIIQGKVKSSYVNKFSSKISFSWIICQVKRAQISCGVVNFYRLVCLSRGSILKVCVHGRLDRKRNCSLMHALGLVASWLFLQHNTKLFCQDLLGTQCINISLQFLRCQELASFPSFYV